jgi:hypothetical protein
MKKRISITLLAVTLFSPFAEGQKPADEGRKFDRQAYQARRNAFITAEVSLTADEAEVFIPLDNELKQKQFDAGRECRRLLRESRQQDTLSDELCLKLIDCSIETRIKEAQLEKEYFEKFRHILSPSKLYRYRLADFKFMQEFMGGRNHLPEHKALLREKEKNTK